LFATFMSHIFKAAELAPSTTASFADDITCNDMDAFIRIQHIAEARGITLSKIRILASDITKVPANLQKFVVVTAQHLGATLSTDINQGVAHFAASLESRTETTRQIAGSPLPLQLQWHMIDAIAKSTRWRFMATHPRFTMPSAALADATFTTLVDSFGLPHSQATHTTRTLQFTNIASGGMGLSCLASQGAAIYDCVTAAGIWPPTHPILDIDGFIQRPATIRTAMQALQQREAHLMTESLGALFVKATADTGIAWHRVSPTTKHLALNDDEWRTFWTLTFRYTCLEIQTCCKYVDEGRGCIDHIQTCRVCATPYWHPRHQAVQGCIRAVALRNSIVCTDHFSRSIGGVSDTDRKVPDLLFYRSAFEKKPLVIDVSIAHHRPDSTNDMLKKRDTQKRGKYKNWRADMVEFAPLVLGSTATIPKFTYEVLGNIASISPSKGTLYELTAKIKITLVRFECFRVRALRARKASGALDREATQVNETVHSTDDDDGA
jgi:hypothetical protein